MEILIVIILLIVLGAIFSKPSSTKNNKGGLSDIEKFITFKDINKK